MEFMNGIGFRVISVKQTRKANQREPGCCVLRQEMAAEFATAARLYAEAVVAFTRNDLGQMSRHRYDQLLKSTQQARRRSEKAGIAFEEHIHLHRCGLNNSSDEAIANA
jgi:hypothetical protein